MMPVLSLPTDTLMGLVPAKKISPWKPHTQCQREMPQQKSKASIHKSILFNPLTMDAVQKHRVVVLVSKDSHCLGYAAL